MAAGIAEHAAKQGLRTRSAPWHGGCEVGCMRTLRLVPTIAIASLLVMASCSSASPDGSLGQAPINVGPGGAVADGGGALTDAGPQGNVGGNQGSDGGMGPRSDAGSAPVDAGGSKTDAGGVHDAGSVPLTASDHCQGATQIPLTTVNAHLDLNADTTSATPDVGAPCSADSGADVFYQFTISKAAFIYADTFGTSWSTVLYLLGSNCAPLTATTTPGDALCNESGCGTSQSQIVALLQPGNYRLGLGGSGGATGKAVIHFEFALAGSGTATALPKGASQQSGITVGVSGNVNNLSQSCVAAGPEDAYWWTTCPQDSSGSLVASTCGGASWETLLETEVPGTMPYKCALDTCGMQTELTTAIPAGAGLRVLLVDGQAGTSAGAYTMQVNRP